MGNSSSHHFLQTAPRCYPEVVVELTSPVKIMLPVDVILYVLGIWMHGAQLVNFISSPFFPIRGRAISGRIYPFWEWARLSLQPRCTGSCLRRFLAYHESCPRESSKASAAKGPCCYRGKKFKMPFVNFIFWEDPLDYEIQK